YLLVLRLRAVFFTSPFSAVSVFLARVRRGLASASTATGSAFLRVRLAFSGAGSAAIADASSSPATPAGAAAPRRRRAGLVLRVSAGGTLKLGGGASSAGGCA